LEAQGNRDEASAVLRKAADSRPNDSDYLSFPTWLLVQSHFYELRDPARAVELARKAVELAPDDGSAWNILGAARYRAGSWKAAITAVEKAMALKGAGDSFDWFLLAMAHWRNDEPDAARRWYDRAVQWMEQNQPQNEELRRFRAEAAEVLGLSAGADGQSGKGPNHCPGPPADAVTPEGPEAFAQP
jgi:Flp pilus assembly protein TadD